MAASDNDAPISNEQRLLMEVLERELTHAEKAALRQAAAIDPSIRDASRVIRHVIEEKAAHQYQRGQEHAFARFSQQLQATKGVSRTSIPASSFWDRMAEFFARRAPLLATGFVAQTVAVVWLATTLHQVSEVIPTQGSEMRGAPPLSACPPYVVFLKAQAQEMDISRVLLQNNVRVMDGPTENGGYMVSAAGIPIETLSSAIEGIAESVEPNPACVNPS